VTAIPKTCRVVQKASRHLALILSPPNLFGWGAGLRLVLWSCGHLPVRGQSTWPFHFGSVPELKANIAAHGVCCLVGGVCNYGSVSMNLSVITHCKHELNSWASTK